MLTAEELLLVCLDDASGRPRVSRKRLSPALGAALVVELILRERISIAPPDAVRAERGRVRLISSVSTDDAELDWVIDHLQAWTQIKASQLVADVSGPRIVDRLANRLVEVGTLSAVEGTTFGNRTWPTRDPEPAREIRARIRAAVVAGAEPTERTAALIALLDSVGQVRTVISAIDPQVDRSLVRERGRELSQGDWAATTARSVARSQAGWRLVFGGSSV